MAIDTRYLVPDWNTRRAIGVVVAISGTTPPMLEILAPVRNMHASMNNGSCHIQTTQRLIVAEGHRRHAKRNGHFRRPDHYRRSDPKHPDAQCGIYAERWRLCNRMAVRHVRVVSVLYSTVLYLGPRCELAIGGGGSRLAKYIRGVTAAFCILGYRLTVGNLFNYSTFLPSKLFNPIPIILR
jgi:hypothetical protein